MQEQLELWESVCTCPKECDCENPPSDEWEGHSGVYHISNHCPVHNENPYPDPDCFFCRKYFSKMQ